MKLCNKETNRWDVFDYIGVVCYTGYKERVAELQVELKRIGIADRVQYHWDSPSVYRDCLYKAVGMSTYNSKGGSFFMGVNNYNVIKVAYELGCRNVLVMEDDISFLKNTNLINAILASTPTDWDMLMLDRSKPSEVSIEEFKRHTSERINNYWCPLKKATGCGCYALSRRGMEHYLNLIENEVRNNKIRNSDFYFRDEWDGTVYWDKSYKRYFCFPHIAVQRVAGKSGAHCSMKNYWEANEYLGLSQGNYALPYPVVTSSNYRELFARKQAEYKGIMILSGNGISPLRYQTVKACFPNEISEHSNGQSFTKSFVFGCSKGEGNIESLQVAYRDNAQIVVAEDGFIRSCDTWCGNSKPQYKEAHSIMFDTAAFYFDATKISNIEKMLNDVDLVITAEQRAEARRLIDKIVKNKVSKYNHQPMAIPSIGRPGVPKVLVVDQSYGDFSIKLGMADESTFEKMLQKAIEDNPESDIIVKTHPDTIAGKKGEKKGYYQDLQEHDNIYKMTEPINPYSLMEVCDKVYVCTSQFGIEALMAGKEVHVFGMPFYAGWGLTIDEQHLERRTNIRTIEELFYIFYCMYTHWVDPESQSITTIDKVIDKMILLRERYQRDPNKAVARPTNNGYVLGKQQAVRRTVHQELTISKRATLGSSRSSWL